MHYRWKTGMLAWVLFRISGLALVFYIVMHINVISNLHDPAKFDETMRFLGSWQFRMLELGLFAAVLYHGLNGIRIFLVDFFNGSVKQATIFWSLMGAAVILFAAGAYPMFSRALYAKDHPAVAEAHQPAMHEMKAMPGGKCPVYHEEEAAAKKDDCCPKEGK